MIEKQNLQKTLLVTQLNCRGLNKNKIEILSILEKPKPTKLARTNHPSVEGYNLAGNTKNSRLRSAIYIKHTLNYKLIEK